mmetsp:Transcript_6277/g.9123  ORF Transcript_6277/g.9123 Transcript_6277/m.9123 type:complete len:307 (-) Transcript_6277:29-949(-)
MSFNLDALLSHMKKTQEPLEEATMKKLCRYVRDILIEESNVPNISAPVNVCGDIHGQFHDLLSLFEEGGEIPDASYVFLGDYVDRGYFSVETLTYLLLLKARYPSHITLIRGNHETRQITSMYGFYEECDEKYGNPSVYTACCEVFDCFNVAAVIENKFFCVHGGLSPKIKTIEQIRAIYRQEEIPMEGPFCDLVWSDPEEITNWAASGRGAGYLFGSNVTKAFNQLNGISMICRAHQLVMEGYQKHFPEESCVTVWSAPNYCYRCGNQASIMLIDRDLNYDFKLFREKPLPESVARKVARNSYFT